MPLPIPFPMTAGVAESVRHAQMAVCLRLSLPRLRPSPIDPDAVLSIACYGPSLLDTWPYLTHPILSMSGAHDFLLARGIVPDYHVDMDPRVSKVAHILQPHPRVRYLMASCCHPFTWSVLRNHNVEIFHVPSGKHTRQWISTHDPDPSTIFVLAGSCIGFGAIHLGGVLGYRHFEIHGFDGSFHNGSRHAGPHYGYAQEAITIVVNNQSFQTSKIMHNSNVELINGLHAYPFYAVFYGDGLVQAMIAERDGALPHIALAGSAKAARIRSIRRRQTVSAMDASVEESRIYGTPE